jgi:biotin carboxylase
MTGRVLLIGGRAESVRKAIDCGLDVVYLQKPSRFDPALSRLCPQIHLVDFQDVPLVTALVDALHDVRPFDRVLSQTEAAQLVTGHLTTRLGLPGNSADTVRTLHDKARLRTLLNEHGIGPVAAGTISSRTTLWQFVDRHGPSVVKPTMASGSLGVRIVRSPAEVDDAWEWVTSFGFGAFLAEELLSGVEVSVESVSTGGRHTIVSITGKDTGDGVFELGHVVPAHLGDDDRRRVADFTRQVLDAIGVTEGLAHSEVMLTVDGPRLVEAHSRRAGGRIDELVRLVYEIDLERVAYELVGQAATPPIPGRPRGAAAVRFLQAAAGRVVGIEGVAIARSIAGVREVTVAMQPGDVVHPMSWSEDRCGHVLVQGSDPESATRLARRAADAVRIVTVPLGDPPPPRSMRTMLADVDEVLDPFLPPIREGGWSGVRTR